MKTRLLNVALFAAICAVFASALCVAYSMGRADEGSVHTQQILQEARERTAQTVVATQRPVIVPAVVQAPPTVMSEPPAEESEPLVDPQDEYRKDVPLSRDLQAVLREACRETNISVELALGIIEVESGFDPDAVSSCGCYGYMQLHPAYFPPDLCPEDNIRVGVAYLAECISRYGDLCAGLRAYNRGYDDGERGYVTAVLEAADRWAEVRP